jgi:tetratricopeptide (TPR) repeat protein
LEIQQRLQTAWNLVQQGQWQRAEQILLDGIAQQADHPGLLNAMAVLSYQQGRQAMALDYFERAAVSEDSAEAWCNLGSALCDYGQFERAYGVLMKSLASASDHPFAAFTLARACKGMGQPAASLEHIQRAIAGDGQDADFRIFRAMLAVESDQWDMALADLAFLSSKNLPPQQKLLLANLYLQTGQFALSIPHYEALVDLFPDYFDAWMGLGAAFERANDLLGLERAIAGAESAARLTEQHGALKQLQAKLAYRNKRYEDSARLLQDVWSMPGGNVLWKSQVGFEYGQSLDKAGRYAEAWQAFRQAHALRNDISRDSSGDRQALDFFELLERPVSGLWPAVPSQDMRPDPVFVIGFPRSGTTLLEQILDAQPGLVSFDEQPFLAKTLLRLQQMGIAYPDQLHTLTQRQLADLRGYYFEQAESKVSVMQGLRLVDKNPLNWARLPLIRALFPEASIILALRHPCDVILSCYMQNLRSTVLSGSFSRFERIADLYIALADYWQRIAPQLDIPVMVSRYEDLVSMPEQSTRKLAEFLGLPWSEVWLNSSSHARDKAIIHTPSYAQVLEPLNTRALDRWRNYRDCFDAAVLARLRPSVEAMGYDLG